MSHLTRGRRVRAASALWPELLVTRGRLFPAMLRRVRRAGAAERANGLCCGKTDRHRSGLGQM